MASQEIVLTDVESAAFSEAFCLTSSPDSSGTAGPKLAGSDHWSISKSTLRGGLSDGVDVVEIQNGELSILALPTRGMGIWKAEFRGVPIGWQSPVRLPVNPAFVNLKERDGLGWLNGFNELMCRCGLSFHGPPGMDGDSEVTLHGRIANLPAHKVVANVCDEGEGTLSVTGTVDECSLFGPALRLESTVSTVAGSNSLTIRDRIINLGGQPTEFEILYHTNFGRPFMEEGSQLVVPVGEIAPRDPHSASGLENWDLYPAPQAGMQEEAFFFDLQSDADDQTEMLLKNAAGDLGVSMSWRKSELPCFTLWKNPQAEPDGYVTGLEPGTSLPNLKSFERDQGRLITLGPGESYDCGFTMSIFDSESTVTEASDRVASRAIAEAVVHAAPIAKYSPS
jgi:galactose mutarotase-like enzyme